MADLDILLRQRGLLPVGVGIPTFETLADLKTPAFPVPQDGQQARVFGDPDVLLNGYYVFLNGDWGLDTTMYQHLTDGTGQVLEDVRGALGEVDTALTDLDTTIDAQVARVDGEVALSVEQRALSVQAADAASAGAVAANTAVASAQTVVDAGSTILAAAPIAQAARDEASAIVESAKTISFESLPLTLAGFGPVSAVDFYTDVAGVSRALSLVTTTGKRASLYNGVLSFDDDYRATQTAAVIQAAQATITGPIVPDSAGNLWRSVTYDAVGRVSGGTNWLGTDYLLQAGALVPAGSTVDAAPTDVAYVQDPTTLKHWAAGNKKLIIAIGWGQSNTNARNRDDGVAWPLDPLISTEPIYPALALMGQQGVRNKGETITSFVPLIENVTADGARETFASGFANHLIRTAATELPNAIVRVATVVCATNGKMLSELDRGTQTYAWILQSVRDMTALAKAQGWEVEAHVFPKQGEENLPDDAWIYRTNFVSFWRGLQDDLRTITGQTQRPMCFIDQVDSAQARAIDDPRFRQPGPDQAMYELHGLHHIRLVGPGYQYPISSDGVHLACVGQYRRGQIIAAAFWAEMAGRGWQPLTTLRDYGRWISSTELVLEFTTAGGNLVIDQSGNDVATAGMMTKFGWDAVSDRGTAQVITDITLLPWTDTSRLTSRAKFTFAAQPDSRVTMYYANRRNVGGTGGPITGARGLFRNDKASVSIFDNRNVFSWLPVHRVPVDRP